MAVEIEYFDKSNIPCPNMLDAAEQADRIAGVLEQKGKLSDEVVGICLMCGIKVVRRILLDGRISYMPGRGWPENCSKLNPEIRTKRKGKKRY